MELRHLRHFIAVAEELHFGRAATRLGIAQPALSQSLRRLETSLGVELLDRSRRHVQLTAAGSVLLEHGRGLLVQAERCEHETQRAAAGVVKNLRIGYSTSALFDVLPRCLERFGKRWPAVEVSMRDYPVPEQLAGLFSGALDVAFMSHHGPAVPGLEMLTLERQTILVAVPAGSPLAKKPSVRLGELSGYPFVTARSALTQLDAAIAAACRAAEYVPKVVQYAGQVQALLSLVANNIGVSFVPEKAKHLHVDGVVLKPVDDFPPDVYLDTVVACLAEGASPMVRLFLAEVRQTFGLNEDLGARVELADSAPRRARGADRPATADKI